MHSLLLTLFGVLAPPAYRWLPIPQILPRGWLLKQLTIQGDTLCGHLEDFFVNESDWIGPEPKKRAPYNQKYLEAVPYWLTGLVPLAAQLNSSKLLGVAHRYVEGILNRQMADGWMGPLNKSDVGTLSPWPRYRLLSALLQYAQIVSASSAERVHAAAHRLVHRLHAQLNATGPGIVNAYPWAHARWHELVFNIHALIDADSMDTYGDRSALLAAADLAERLGLNWTAWYDARLCENATDTRCFPCGDAKSKECAVGAAEECT